MMLILLVDILCCMFTTHMHMYAHRCTLILSFQCTHTHMHTYTRAHTYTQAHIHTHTPGLSSTGDFALCVDISPNQHVMEGCMTVEVPSSQRTEDLCRRLSTSLSLTKCWAPALLLAHRHDTQRWKSRWGIHCCIRSLTAAWRNMSTAMQVSGFGAALLLMRSSKLVGAKLDSDDLPHLWRETWMLQGSANRSSRDEGSTSKVAAFRYTENPFW